MKENCMMKSTLCLCLAVVTCFVLVSGCATTGENTVIEGPQKITSHDLDTQDFEKVAGEMIASLIESGALDKAAQRPAVIAIGRIVNDTGLDLRIVQLTKKIRVALIRSGKAKIDMSGGNLNVLDFTLSGRIIQPPNARDGNKTQRTYIFQLSLTDNHVLAVWEEEKEVSKLTKRPGIGR